MSVLAADRFDDVLGPRRGVPGAVREPAVGACPPPPQGGWLPATLGAELATKEYFATGQRRQKVSTPCKEFNDQTSSVGPGNVLGATFTGQTVRCANETVNAVGELVDHGHLRDWDLAHAAIELPADALAYVRHVSDQVPCRVYQLHHTAADGTLVVHAHAVCDTDGRMLACWPGTHRHSRAIAAACAPYFALAP